MFNKFSHAVYDRRVIPCLLYINTVTTFLCTLVSVLFKQFVHTHLIKQYVASSRNLRASLTASPWKEFRAEPSEGTQRDPNWEKLYD